MYGLTYMLQYTEDVYEKDLAHALLLSKLEVEEKKVVGVVRHIWGCYSKVVELLNRQWCVYDLLSGGGAKSGNPRRGATQKNAEKVKPKEAKYVSVNRPNLLAVI